MKERLLRCYARGTAGKWEAMCIDLDIAVEAGTRAEVEKLLEEAVLSYIQDAVAENPRQIERLLSRRAPFWVRWSIMLSAFRHLTRTRSNNKTLHASFDLACPA